MRRQLGGRGRATKKDGRLIRALRVAANTGAAGALRWQENILCTATPAPTTVVPRFEARRYREGDRGAKNSRPAQVPSFPTERAWLEGRSRVKGEPHMVRPWNRLTSRGTVRSSLHEILRSPEETRRGVKDPHSTRQPCRRAGTTEKVQTNGDGGTIFPPPPSSPFPPLSINRKPPEDRNTPPPWRYQVQLLLLLPPINIEGIREDRGDARGEEGNKWGRVGWGGETKRGGTVGTKGKRKVEKKRGRETDEEQRGDDKHTYPLPTGTQPRATPTSPDHRRRAQRRPHSPIVPCT
ncbi:hypothetical protein NDU88_000809 [Pleurodeles waltl]|uniref:Uncharacterized protein n=1 Tax=Pleurodeles waltl TaxID=8319 RepID=A0AAV7UR23_PLEWA|nr:hypothetical protein NDU88_000809 [Pleurodeles waltl]